MGGVNLYGYSSGDQVNHSDPFGLRDDITYDVYGKEISRVVNGEPDRWFLKLGGRTYRLDYALKESSTPYQVLERESDFDRIAVLMADDAPVFTNRVAIAAICAREGRSTSHDSSRIAASSTQEVAE
ncbi:MAG: hypothetical protein IPJ78_19090 [Gemmatimonadetes bacterium]|nr:hypothetical protein [Gemmatimonadota bacterium]